MNSETGTEKLDTFKLGLALVIILADLVCFYMFDEYSLLLRVIELLIGAGIGIGMFASAAANATSRQPEAANDIRSAVNLPLFLLEGVAIIALVVCLLASF